MTYKPCLLTEVGGTIHMRMLRKTWSGPVLTVESCFPGCDHKENRSHLSQCCDSSRNKFTPEFRRQSPNTLGKCKTPLLCLQNTCKSEVYSITYLWGEIDLSIFVRVNTRTDSVFCWDSVQLCAQHL